MKKDIQKGTQLCARFAYRPNALEYCGRTSATQKLLNCIQKEDCQEIEEEITKFKALHSYLKLISDKVKLPLLHYKVCEAYWIGNELLDQFDQADFQRLLELFAEQNVPDFFLKDLEVKFNKSSMKFLPHHAFNVLFVGVGQITSSVRYSLANINNCLIRWGNVTAIKDLKIKVNGGKLRRASGTLTFKEEMETFDMGYEEKLEIGDRVAVHWGEVCLKTDDSQIQKLEKYTNILLRAFNHSSV